MMPSRVVLRGRTRTKAISQVTLINTVKSGHFVLIEFGHNDGSSGSVDNGRQDAFGSDTATTSTVTDSK